MATRTSTANGWDLDQDLPRQSRLKALLNDSALLRLLRYVPPHRKYAVLTALFGTLGFLLSFLYPWIIGSAVDLVTGEHLQDLAIQSRYHRLLELTGMAIVTGALHAIVLYGRGHFNARLAEAIFTDLRRDLFDHLQHLSLAFGATLVALDAPAEATPTDGLRPGEVARGEALDSVDYADPFVLRDGDRYYAFATNGNGVNVQVAVANEFSAWRRLPDALPQLPSWGLKGATWAPTVLKRKSGYVLFFTVRERASGFQCISRAFASSPEGPYTDGSDRPLICQTSGIDALCGSIDPSPFVDEDGTAYLYWKSDENSPACRTSPRIWVQQLTEDGLALKGTARSILSADQPWEAPIVEGPAMVRSGQEYFLFYSANWYASDAYAVGYAKCRSAAGPCQKVPTTSPWLRSHGSRLGPGGQEFFSDARGQLYMAYHAWLAPSTSYERGGIRSLHIEPVAFLGSVPKLVPPVH